MRRFVTVVHFHTTRLPKVRYGGEFQPNPRLRFVGRTVLDLKTIEPSCKLGEASDVVVTGIHPNCALHSCCNIPMLTIMIRNTTVVF
jgi:hypothetical protein